MVQGREEDITVMETRWQRSARVLHGDSVRVLEGVQLQRGSGR